MDLRAAYIIRQIAKRVNNKQDIKKIRYVEICEWPAFQILHGIL